MMAFNTTSAVLSQSFRDFVRFADPDEKWKDVENHERYAVSSHGRMFSSIRGRLMAVPLTGEYPSVRLDGVLKLVHRLVAIAFVAGRTRERWSVDHDDGDKTNNRADNLRWATPAEQARNRGGLGGVCGYRGVTKSGTRFQANGTKPSGQVLFLGTYATALEAAVVHALHAEQRDGNFLHSSLKELLKEHRSIAATIRRRRTYPSQYGKGVYKRKDGKFRVHLSVKGKSWHGGVFVNLADAQARSAAMQEELACSTAP